MTSVSGITSRIVLVIIDSIYTGFVISSSYCYLETCFSVDYKILNYRDGWTFACIFIALKNQTLPHSGAIEVSRLQDSF